MKVSWFWSFALSTLVSFVLVCQAHAAKHVSISGRVSASGIQSRRDGLLQRDLRIIQQKASSLRRRILDRQRAGASFEELEAEYLKFMLAALRLASKYQLGPRRFSEGLGQPFQNLQTQYVKSCADVLSHQDTKHLRALTDTEETRNDFRQSQEALQTGNLPEELAQKFLINLEDSYRRLSRMALLEKLREQARLNAKIQSGDFWKPVPVNYFERRDWYQKRYSNDTALFRFPYIFEQVRLGKKNSEFQFSPSVAEPTFSVRELFDNATFWEEPSTQSSTGRTFLSTNNAGELWRVDYEVTEEQNVRILDLHVPTLEEVRGFVSDSILVPETIEEKIRVKHGLSLEKLYSVMFASRMWPGAPTSNLRKLRLRYLVGIPHQEKLGKVYWYLVILGVNQSSINSPIGLDGNPPFTLISFYPLDQKQSRLAVLQASAHEYVDIEFSKPFLQRWKFSAVQLTELLFGGRGFSACGSERLWLCRDYSWRDGQTIRVWLSYDWLTGKILIRETAPNKQEHEQQEMFP